MARSRRVKWLNHYSSAQTILIVGDGDFSFSLALATAFGSGENLVATSLDSYEVLAHKYTKAQSNAMELKRMGAKVLHGISAKSMMRHSYLETRRFHRIVFNFPHAGFNGKEYEMHVVMFQKQDYPGYNQKRGDGAKSNQTFPLGDCSTFKFGVKPNEGQEDSFCDDFTQALVCVGDSQIPSLATTNKNKNHRDAERALKTGQEMASIHVQLRVGEYVYNHLRKWRQRWLTISRLRDLSGAQWCEDTKCIVLEAEHYCGRVVDHPNDAEFLNVPVANYDEMHTIFSFGLATGKYAVGSSEPLGSAAGNPAPEDADTQESDTVKLDGAPEKAGNAPEKVTGGKRKRGAFADDELVAFTNMIVAVKDVAQAIRDNKPTDMHPDMYNVVMDMLGFAEDDLMAALSHLVDHKAQGSSFVNMIEPHRVLWLRNYLGKFHSKV
ncbi:hypothetical protein QYE76_006079 [Lolium multiflorum]|uniref:25S rRNA (uridine-N(3))-methyltransferase BMT5-like domain-containing protein n=1 Tax=Lolium multiflorum TaxID=4521 RepID=A0AAD8RVA5_LOLMU|nr:hypothetical protein QYE76_006079 [Lolium multiflorum]